jgi:hypothetical protein
MTQRIADSKPVKEFVEIAREFVQFIDNREKYSEIEIYLQAYKLLLRLILCAENLPSLVKASYLVETSLMLREAHRAALGKQIYESLTSKLDKNNNIYLFVFDPYRNLPASKGEKVEDAITSTISCDLCEIYDDLSEGLQLWPKSENSMKRDLICTWKTTYEGHWGHHAVITISALYSLLYRHLEFSPSLRPLLDQRTNTDKT